MSEQPKCELCGHPMPEGEEMFKYHGYSGPCPGEPLRAQEPISAVRRDYEGWLPPRPHWTEVCFEAYCAGRLDEKTTIADPLSKKVDSVWDSAIDACIDRVFQKIGSVAVVADFGLAELKRGSKNG